MTLKEMRDMAKRSFEAKHAEDDIDVGDGIGNKGVSHKQVWASAQPEVKTKEELLLERKTLQRTAEQGTFDD